MTKEFKEGEKVSCPIQGRGKIEKILDYEDYPVYVNFESNIYSYYSLDGKLYKDDKEPSLYHGHGTFKIEFIEEKKTEYEWQWLYKYRGLCETTGFYKTHQEMFKNFGKCNEIIERIEQSKKEALK